MSMSLCLLEDHTAELHQMSVHIACGRDSETTIRYVLPVFWMTSCIIHTMALWRIMCRPIPTRRYEHKDNSRDSSQILLSDKDRKYSL